ncbi:hypothetical protein BCAR13_840179 [Paraburkholderia caribensis]|nr:hypothetical protein BCAR13_840179 [Paraburkholderia caribensis]
MFWCVTVPKSVLRGTVEKVQAFLRAGVADGVQQSSDGMCDLGGLRGERRDDRARGPARGRRRRPARPRPGTTPRA